MPVICINCNIKMDFPRSGIHVLETYEDGNKPYKVWSADYYECPKCGHRVATGFGQSPIGQDFEEDFEEKVKTCEVKFK